MGSRRALAIRGMLWTGVVIGVCSGAALILRARRRLAEHEDRLAAHDAKFGTLFVAMSDACDSAGLPRLRLVGGERDTA